MYCCRYGAKLVDAQINSTLLDIVSTAHPVLKVARVIGKKIVLPAEKRAFEYLEDFGAKKQKK